MFQWEVESLGELQNTITNSGIKGEGLYNWVWETDSSGVYSVKPAYKWLHSEETTTSNVFYNKLWKNGVPLKVKAFAWKVSQDRIPTV